MKNRKYGISGAALALAIMGSSALAADVTIVMPGGPDRLDPCETPRSVIGRIIKQNVVESLVELNYANGSILPRLATSWTQDSPTEWTFKLREGVSFHDGAPFNAAAVVYTLERTLDKDLTCITRTKYFDGIEVNAEAVDEHTLRVVTGTPVPILPTLLAQLVISSPNTPKGEYTATPIGTGPYEFVEWRQGEDVIITQYDGYWGEGNDIENVKYVWRSESSVAAAMVETGEADIAFSIAPQDATNPALDRVYPNSETSIFRLSLDTPPLDDVRVRKAVNMAIDRQAFLGTIISEEAQMATQQVGPSNVGHNEALEPWPYDPEGAKALLAEAKADGVPVDTEIRIVGRPGMFSNSTELVEAVAEMLRSVGFKVNVVNMEVAQWLEVANKPFAEDRPPTMMLSQHDNNTGDAAFTLFFKYGSEGRQSEVADSELDAMILEAGTLSGQERDDMYKEVQRRIYEDMVADVPLFHMVNYMRVGERVEFKPTIANAVELQLTQVTIK